MMQNLRYKIFVTVFCLFYGISCAHIYAGDTLLQAIEGRTTISLNGEWDFEQTLTAFPPPEFTRKIPVPGLVHLATPKIEQYDLFFQRPTDTKSTEHHDFSESNYTPMYNWYKRKIDLTPALKGQQIYLTINKSQYVTVVYVNGMLIGRSMECYTPIDLNITDAVRWSEENEILIQVGDRAWLPGEAAGSTDKEKTFYIPGIWDDVFITATGNIKVDKVLFLPSLEKKKVTVKTRLLSAYPPPMVFGVPETDPCHIEFIIKEKISGKIVASKEIRGEARRDNRSYFETEIEWDHIEAWTPEKPFLYEGEVRLYDKGKLTDIYSTRFGMRDFSGKGRYFALNGEKYYLKGSNVTLHRFFEDPDCGDLPWNREWVKKLMIDLPKSSDWNTMRICVGIVPDFWYDLCDEYGILLQNEWLYWQNHGWDEQIRKEYTEWVWSDGNHPSIVIWDAINENWHEYIGNVLIPELKQLDPTRIWDAGYMTSDNLDNDEMDEPHPYHLSGSIEFTGDQLDEYYKQNPYDLGDLHYWMPYFKNYLNAGVPLLFNEYGWIWLWRDGKPSKLTVNNYNYYLGEKAASADACRELQAYWLQIETEWLRTERNIAGVLAFAHLTNNYGFTGDWFMNDIKDLKVSPAFRWLRHCFAPEAVFIDLVDHRYTKHINPYIPGSTIVFNLVGINDHNKESKGRLNLKLYNEEGISLPLVETDIKIDPYDKELFPHRIKLPEQPGGYLLVAEYYPDNATSPVLSRRYLNVGYKEATFNYHELAP